MPSRQAAGDRRNVSRFLDDQRFGHETIEEHWMLMCRGETMRLLMAFFCVFALCELAYSQASNRRSEQMPSLEQTIDTAVYRGLWEGFAEKQWRRSGDAVAVALTKVISEKPLDRGQVETVLDILRSSFYDLSQVSSIPDRQPETTLFVLRYLDCSTQDRALKLKIAETRRHILDQAAKATKSAP